MSKAITNEDIAVLKEAGEMFNETGCVPGIDGEQVPAERMVPDVKEYISEMIDDPGAIYDPEIWDTPGFALVLSWLAKKWNERCRKLAHRRSKSPEQYLTKEQQKACLDAAAAELIREITQGTAIALTPRDRTTQAGHNRDKVHRFAVHSALTQRSVLRGQRKNLLSLSVAPISTWAQARPTSIQNDSG